MRWDGFFLGLLLLGCVAIPVVLFLAVMQAKKSITRKPMRVLLGVGVVAMCPVGGGVLGSASPELRQAIGMDLPTAAMALRFVLSNPNISTACSGMNTMEMLEANVATVKDFEPSESVHQAMAEAVDRLRARMGEQFCTACGYCRPCKAGVDVPRYMGVCNYWKCFGLGEWADEEMSRVPADKALELCIECGLCEQRCPNKLPIRERLKELKARKAGAGTR